MDFVAAATSGRRARAEAILAANPEIARDPWVRLVRGEGWDGDVHVPGGPNGWTPLVYVTHSVFASAAPARELLARGADPNASFTNEHGRMSALYGAAGRVHDPELTRLLLEAGADPDDGESLYHSTEAASPECLRLLLEHGATVEPVILMHALDGERLGHVKLLLDAGVDARGALVHAVRRGRGPETLRLLAERGAELEFQGGETWRRPKRLRTAYQHAVLRGRDDSAALLASLGAVTAVDADDRAVAAIVRGRSPAGGVPEPLDYDQQEALILAALDGRLAHVVEHVGPEFRGVVAGSPEVSLLAHAAWWGDAAAVRFLLDAGASPDGALAAAAHGSAALPGRDHVAVAEQLVAAGEAVEPHLADHADGPLASWLEARH